MKLSAAPALQRFTLKPLRVGTLLLGFSVPISVALDNLLLALVLLGAAFNARAIWRIAAQHPVARAAWLLFLWLSLAMFYGATPLREAAGALGKYIDLAFIPLFMLVLPDEAARRKAQYAFLAAMGLTLLLSFLVGLNLLPVQHWMDKLASSHDAAIFHSRITQNNMMAFAVFLALLNLRAAVSRGARAAWFLFALLGTINVLFMVQGRTGYVILLVLLGWFAWTGLARHMRKLGKTWGWRQGAGLVLVLAGLAAVAYQVSPRLNDRVGLVASEFREWQPNRGKETSTGQRLDFYYNTLQIVRQQPVFGVGTGGFPAAFARQTQGTDVKQTRNPHNEYLMIAAQSGAIGLALLLFLFYTQWRCAPLLRTPFEQDAARGLVLAYMANSLFNSPLLDHADGLFFAFMTAVLFANLKPAPVSAEGVPGRG
ncbi:MAG: hypothetical protein A3F73_03270 [Gallionellales bacterium RIFCSPLOWO2_12_FULL_59_22]|nr:MAG: hypothetical protein A3H99_11740 [Gallionellales bacterium RIFCSPLOWO2_02_FULL_59_110]OGT14327.1 MAG: hypothetical protein A3F73_03270 [Gallionellales bacterium RIFCSPLOWO2_12_FULL_59_22]